MKLNILYMQRLKSLLPTLTEYNHWIYLFFCQFHKKRRVFRMAMPSLTDIRYNSRVIRGSLVFPEVLQARLVPIDKQIIF